MNREWLTKRMFDNTDKNLKANVRWFIELTKDLAEMSIDEEEILNRNIFWRGLISLSLLRMKREDRGNSVRTEKRKREQWQNEKISKA